MRYRGAAIASVAGILQLIFSAGLLRRSRLFIAETIPRLACAETSLALAFNLVFLVVEPITIDRSVTVYLLSQLA